MAESTTETPVRDLLASMTAESIAASGLDAGDAHARSHRGACRSRCAPRLVHAEPRGGTRVGIDAEQVRDVLAAIAPIVGTARVASATGSIVKALAIEIAIAEDEEQDEQ